MEKINYKILILVILGAFLTVGIGFSLAYYTANVSTTGSKDTVVKTANISMTLNMGELVTTSDKWEPGNYMTKSFSVTNNGSDSTFESGTNIIPEWSFVFDEGEYTYKSSVSNTDIIPISGTGVNVLNWSILKNGTEISSN